jgi:hypothetical protein
MAIYSLTKDELKVFARVTELFEEILTELGSIEAYPRDYHLMVDSEIDPFHIGRIGYDEGGCVALQLVDSDEQPVTVDTELPEPSEYVDGRLQWNVYPFVLADLQRDEIVIGPRCEDQYTLSIAEAASAGRALLAAARWMEKGAS